LELGTAFGAPFRILPREPDDRAPADPARRITILAVTAAARRRDRREHTAGFRIDPLDAILGDLKQVLAVEGRSCVRGDIRSVFPLAGSKAFSLSPALHRQLRYPREHRSTPIVPISVPNPDLARWVRVVGDIVPEIEDNSSPRGQ
jgi:hypothetical protein